MTWEDDRQSWLWHLFNDPMRENPWSLVALVVITALTLWALFAGTGQLAERRRRKMFSNRDSDRRIADDAIERARHDQPDEPGQQPPPARDTDREQAERAGLHDVADVKPAELHAFAEMPTAGRRPASLADLPPMAGADLPAPDPVADSGVHALPDLDFQTGTGHFIECTHCQGRGAIMKTTSELLRESIALVGDGGDVVVKEFYTRLFAVAPDLAALFPPDLLTAPRVEHAPDSPPPSLGASQRDKLLGALVALSQTYDPNKPDQMVRLDTALSAFGRSHAAFARPDGSVRGASLEEYAAVKAVLFEVLVDAAGEAWQPAFTVAWSEAYDYAAGVMLAEAVRGGGRSARFPRA